VPKVNGPEISKGFWVTIGVVVALLIVSIIQVVLQRFRAQAAS
jgi:hypothetical protein